MKKIVSKIIFNEKVNEIIEMNLKIKIFRKLFNLIYC